MKYILGVDGGGSKTLATIIDEQGRLVGWGYSGGSNYQSIGIEIALEHISKAIIEALDMGQISKNEVQHSVFGLAGADRPKDLSILEPKIAALELQSYRIVCDTVAGLRLGTSKLEGIVLVCGSGTNAFGRNRFGETVQTGGFGYLFGDWAGGRDLARETFRSAIRSWEHRDRESILVTEVPRWLGYPNISEMISDYLDNDKRDVTTELALLTHQASDMGDELATELLRRTGEELGLAAHSVALRLQGWNEPISVILTGGVIQKGRSPVIIDEVSNLLTSRGWSFNITVPQLHPVFGSVLLALDDVGHSVDDEVLKNWLSSDTV